MRNEPHRYKPQHGTPDPERCAANISHGRLTFSQCAKKHLPDSEWCKTHEPTVATAESPLLFAIDADSRGDLKIVSAKIVKETTKQIKLENGAGAAFGYHTTLTKNETTGEPEVGARSAVAAVERYLAECEATMLRAEEALVRTKDSVEEAKLLLAETKKATES